MASKRVSVSDISDGFNAVIELGKAFGWIFDQIRAATREAGFLRLNKDVVYVVNYIDKKSMPRTGILHMKSMTSNHKDYFLTPESPADLQRLLDKMQSHYARTVKDLEYLADDNRFKNDEVRKIIGWEKNFGQYHVVVKGKGSSLNFSGFPELDDFVVDFMPLRDVATSIAKEGIDDHNRAEAILNAKADTIYGPHWLKFNANRPNLSIMVPWQYEVYKQRAK